MGEKNSHNRNNYERMALGLNYESLREPIKFEEKLFFGLQMTMENTTKITEILRENENQRG